MELSKWIRIQKVEDINFLDKNFATKLNISQPYLCGLKSGRCRPSYELAMKIEKITNGQVTAWEMLNLKPYKG